MSDDTLLNLKNCALNVQGHLMTFEYLLFGMLQTEPFGQLLNYALNDLVALYLSKLSYLLFKQNARNRYSKNLNYYFVFTILIIEI